MTRWVYKIGAALPALLLAACARNTPPVTHAADMPSGGAAPSKREIRVTGIVQAVHATKVFVPQIWGQGGPMTLTKLIPNGTHVKEGDLIAIFDSTQQTDIAREALAKYEDLGHQVEQKVAQNRADAEKRTSDLRQAEADLAKAEIELKKGPVLAELDRLKAELRASNAKNHLESLKRSQTAREKSDLAAVHILELQRDRQKVTLDRTRNNIAKLEVKAKIAGVVAHQNLYRNNSMGHAQEGDQLYQGQAIVSIFDPTEMMVRCAVGEPDGAVLKEGVKATVYLDAYPELVLPATFEFASPVASSALGSPIKAFGAVFKLDKSDPRLMPDLSAAVVVEAPKGGKP
jgi:multidrug efflux pump subunit AcrA (membrane-fusion protein)